MNSIIRTQRIATVQTKQGRGGKLRRLLGLVLVGVSLGAFLSGCMALLFVPEVIEAGYFYYISRDVQDKKVDLAPGVTAEEVKKIKVIGWLLGSPSFSGGRDDASDKIFSDKAAHEMQELLKENTKRDLQKVIDRETFEKAIVQRALKVKNEKSLDSALAIGKDMGVDCLITGSVTTNGSYVQNVVLHMRSVPQGKVLGQVSVNYRATVKMDSAAKALAKIVVD